MVYTKLSAFCDLDHNVDDLINASFTAPDCKPGDVRKKTFDVELNGVVRKLYPALKIQRGLPGHQVMKAFDMIEEDYILACKKNRGNPQREHFRILSEYPHRVTKDHVFLPFSETGNTHQKR